MEEIDHLGIVGGHPLGACLARLAEADDYCVHRFGFDGGEAQLGKLQEMPHQVRALCICASGAPALFRAVAEYLRLSREHRPTYLLNMTPVGSVHAQRIDALLRLLDPTTTFAETAFLGGVRALEAREATAFYGSRSGPPSKSVEKFLLGFAARVIEFQDVAEVRAAKLVTDVASLLAGLAAHEAFVMGQNCGISMESLVRMLSPRAPNGDISLPFATSCSESWNTLRCTPQEELGMLLARASEKGLKDVYIRLLTESREGSTRPPPVGEEN